MTDWREDPEALRLLAQVQRADRALNALAADPSRGQAALGWEKRVAEALRTAREGLGYSQAEVAELLKGWGFEMHQTTLAKLEAGKRPVRLAEVFALAAIYGLTPGTVLRQAETRLDGVDDIDARIEAADEAMRSREREFVQYAQAVFNVIAASAQERAGLERVVGSYARSRRRSGRPDGDVDRDVHAAADEVEEDFDAMADLARRVEDARPRQANARDDRGKRQAEA